MKKIFVFVAVAVALVLAYKCGDSFGYKAGFDAGYAYDCREELGAVAKYAEIVERKGNAIHRKMNRIASDTLSDSLKWGNFHKSSYPLMLAELNNCCIDSASYYNLTMDQKKKYRLQYLLGYKNRNKSQKVLDQEHSSCLSRAKTEQDSLACPRQYKSLKTMFKDMK